jgi:hypothetical protein
MEPLCSPFAPTISTRDRRVVAILIVSWPWWKVLASEPLLTGRIFFLVAGFSPTGFKDMRILIVAVLGNLQIWLEASFAGFNKDMSRMMQIIEQARSC